MPYFTACTRVYDNDKKFKLYVNIIVYTFLLITHTYTHTQKKTKVSEIFISDHWYINIIIMCYSTVRYLTGDAKLST